MIQVQPIFPGPSRPGRAAENPVSHVRYPADFFDVQAAMYRAYHMTDPTVFYNKEDMEALKELFGDKEQLMQSYYLIMKLPGGRRRVHSPGALRADQKDNISVARGTL